MPGRPRVPTNVLKMRGTAQKCRIEKRAGELLVDGPFPDAPEWLTPGALAEWERVKAISDYASCVKSSDRTLLALYCTIADELAREGTLSDGKAKTLLSLGGKFGMSPSDRTKIKGAPKEEAKDDPWAKLG